MGITRNFTDTVAVETRINSNQSVADIIDSAWVALGCDDDGTEVSLGMEDIVQNYREILKRNRRERLVDYGIGAIGITIVFTFVMFIASLIPVALRQPPVEISNVRVLTTEPVCPGDSVSFISSVRVNEPAIIGIWTAIMRADDKNILNHTRMTLSPVPRPEPIFLDEEISFEIPQLEPDDYIRIAAFAAINSDTRPEYVLIPFTVAEDCPPLEE